MQASPCRQTMENQTNKREELYVERAAYGAAFPANGVPYAMGIIGNNQPIESELQAAVYGRCGGASGIRAEHIKAWLRGVKKEEDPETATSHVGAGKTWHKFARLCTSDSAGDVLGDHGPHSKGGGSTLALDC